MIFLGNACNPLSKSLDNHSTRRCLFTVAFSNKVVCFEGPSSFIQTHPAGRRCWNLLLSHNFLALQMGLIIHFHIRSNAVQPQVKNITVLLYPVKWQLDPAWRWVSIL